MSDLLHLKVNRTFIVDRNGQFLFCNVSPYYGSLDHNAGFEFLFVDSVRRAVHFRVLDFISCYLVWFASYFRSNGIILGLFYL